MPEFNALVARDKLLVARDTSLDARGTSSVEAMPQLTALFVRGIEFTTLVAHGTLSVEAMPQFPALVACGTEFTTLVAHGTLSVEAMPQFPALVVRGTEFTTLAAHGTLSIEAMPQFPAFVACGAEFTTLVARGTLSVEGVLQFSALVACGAELTTLVARGTLSVEGALAESKSVIVGSYADAGVAAVDSVEFDERPSRHSSYRAALSSGAGFGGKVPSAKRPESRLVVLLHGEAKTASLGGIVSKSQHGVTYDEEALATSSGDVGAGALRSKSQNVATIGDRSVAFSGDADFVLDAGVELLTTARISGRGEPARDRGVLCSDRHRGNVTSSGGLSSRLSSRLAHLDQPKPQTGVESSSRLSSRPALLDQPKPSLSVTRDKKILPHHFTVAEDSTFLHGQALREPNSLRNPDGRRPDGRCDADADSTTGWMHVGRTLGDGLTARGGGLASRGMRGRSGVVMV
jgi:hypothetical protein